MEKIFLNYKVCILVLAIVNFILGASFLIWSNFLADLNERLKKWIDTEKLQLALNRMRDIDASILRMKKLFGALALVVASILIYLYVKG